MWRIKRIIFTFARATAIFLLLASPAFAVDGHAGHPGASNAVEPFSATTDKSFSVLMKEADTLMHRAMDEIPVTGDPDRDFLAMMIPHHEGAINMAKAFLLYGRDSGLRNLAQKIIVDQQTEINLMSGLAKRYDKQAPPSPSFMAAMKEAMSGMHSAMGKAELKGDPDYDFVALMIPHHAGAIAMARAVLPAARSTELSVLAHQIIIEQGYEIQFMEAWLRMHLLI